MLLVNLAPDPWPAAPPSSLPMWSDHGASLLGGLDGMSMKETIPPGNKEKQYSKAFSGTRIYPEAYVAAGESAVSWMLPLDNDVVADADVVPRISLFYLRMRFHISDLRSMCGHV